MMIMPIRVKFAIYARYYSEMFDENWKKKPRAGLNIWPSSS